MITYKFLPRWRLTPGVYLAQQDEITRVLDLNRGRFYGLDAIASHLLARTLESGPDSAAAEVARTFSAELPEVRIDLEALLTHFQKRHLLQRGEPEWASAGRWLPRWLAGPCPVRGPVAVRLAGRLLR